MEEIQKDLIRLCTGYPEGLSLLEINGLYQRTYGKPLRVGTTKRLQTLLRSMPEHLHLCTNDGMVVWPAASRPSSSSLEPPLASPPAALAAAARPAPHLASPRSVPASGKAAPKMKKSLARIVALINDFPDGLPVNKVAEHYKKKYGKNLTLASLGFRSMAHLLDSLGDNVVVEGELVFHRSHCPPGGAGAAPEARDADQSHPQEADEWASASALPVVDSQPVKARKKRDRSERRASPAPTTGLPLAFGVSPAPPGQDQLLQRITKVVENYGVASL
ncbi:hypothetical protein CRUP_001624 [Coryphaenoides rupestris]|nr:hypothetical protein CRUP_001624 [Coryphaenoides rupestris]